MKNGQLDSNARILLVWIVLVGILSASIVVSLPTGYFVIGNTGRISAYVTAASGSARDIQAAVNLVVAAGGKGDVHIPNGTFNFLNVGESWKTVNIPAGVNVMAETAPDMDPSWDNRFPLTCYTVLKLPFDVPGILDNSKFWFRITGTGDPTMPSRFSGIKLQGYRSIVNSSFQLLPSIEVYKVMDFRVDHCIFENVALGLVADGGSTAKCRGVFDHNKIVNTVGWVDPDNYNLLTVGYGIWPAMYHTTYWDPNITHILGKYLDYSIYIEDNYFSKWRHCVCAASGVHAVVRFNVFNLDYAYASTDVHGSPQDLIGGRCFEVYNNTFTNAVNDGGWDADGVYHSTKGFGSTINEAVHYRGGGGVCFNNTLDSTYYWLAAVDNDDPGRISNPGGESHNVWIFNNYGVTRVQSSGPVSGRDYWVGTLTLNPATGYALPALQNSGVAPPQASFNYTAYQYPHPLVQ